MADEEVDETPEVEETEYDPARARAALEKRNRENHSLRQRLKELEPLAAKAREADEANKTELQKANDALTALQRERDDARLALMKRDAADEAGLPRSWAERLRGATAEELLADAKNLAKDLAPPAQQTSSRPVPDLRSGALPASDSQPLNADDWLRGKARR